MISLIVAIVFVLSYYKHRENHSWTPWIMFTAGMMVISGMNEVIRKFYRGEPLITWHEMFYISIGLIAGGVLYFLINKFRKID